MHVTKASPNIRAIALEHFTGRIAAMRKLAQQQGESWPGDPANENAQLWLAIALAAGAGPDLPADVRERIAVDCLWPRGKRALPHPGQIAQPHAYLGELARARDAAIAKADQRPKDQRAIQRAIDLRCLAEALGAPAYDTTPQPERNAA